MSVDRISVCPIHSVILGFETVQVLTWLEANARRVIARADSRDPLIDDCVKK